MFFYRYDHGKLEVKLLSGSEEFRERIKMYWGRKEEKENHFQCIIQSTSKWEMMHLPWNKNDGKCLGGTKNSRK